MRIHNQGIDAHGRAIGLVGGTYYPCTAKSAEQSTSSGQVKRVSGHPWYTTLYSGRSHP